MTSSVAKEEILPTVVCPYGKPPYLSVIKDIEEFVSMHYSLPRRDITDYFFKATVKEMKRQLAGPYKEAFLKEERFKGHSDYLGKMQQAAIHFYFTGVIDYKTYSLPRNLGIREFIMTLYPVVVERIHHVYPDITPLMEVFLAPMGDTQEEKKNNGNKKKFMKRIMFGVRFRFGEYPWSRFFYQSNTVIEKGYVKFTSNCTNSPKKEEQDRFGLAEFEGIPISMPFYSSGSTENERLLDPHVKLYSGTLDNNSILYSDNKERYETGEITVSQSQETYFVNEDRLREEAKNLKENSFCDDNTDRFLGKEIEVLHHPPLPGSEVKFVPAYEPWVPTPDQAKFVGAKGLRALGKLWDEYQKKK